MLAVIDSASTRPVASARAAFEPDIATTDLVILPFWAVSSNPHSPTEAKPMMFLTGPRVQGVGLERIWNSG
jgi:hypothetical protein